jgi:hypothetical protein
LAKKKLPKNSTDSWRLFQLQWVSIWCAIQTSADLRAARDFDAAFERVADTRNMIVAMLNGSDESMKLAARSALEPAIEYCDDQLTQIRQAHRQRAFDEESGENQNRFEHVVMRKMLEHGITPMQYAALRNPQLADDRVALKEIGDRVRAQTERSTIRRFCELSRDVLLKLFDDAASGCAVFLPVGEVFRDRLGRRYLSRWPTPMDASREIERLTRLIERLSPHRGS